MILFHALVNIGECFCPLGLVHPKETVKGGGGGGDITVWKSSVYLPLSMENSWCEEIHWEFIKVLSLARWLLSTLPEMKPLLPCIFFYIYILTCNNKGPVKGNGIWECSCQDLNDYGKQSYRWGKIRKRTHSENRCYQELLVINYLLHTMPRLYLKELKGHILEIFMHQLINTDWVRN